MRLNDCDQPLSEAIPFHHKVKDISAVETAPARHPQTFSTLQEIDEVIFFHAPLTTCTGHDALLVCISSHENTESLGSWVDLKGVPQTKGDMSPNACAFLEGPAASVPTPTAEAVPTGWQQQGGAESQEVASLPSSSQLSGRQNGTQQSGS